MLESLPIFEKMLQLLVETFVTNVPKIVLSLALDLLTLLSLTIVISTRGRRKPTSTVISNAPLLIPLPQRKLQKIEMLVPRKRLMPFVLRKLLCCYLRI